MAAARVRSTSDTLSTIKPARCRSVVITTSLRPAGAVDAGMSKRRRWSMTGSTSPRQLTMPSRNFGVFGSRVICADSCATSITASIGTATYTPRHRFPSTLAILEAADHALYAAKLCGRNRVECYQDLSATTRTPVSAGR